MPISVQSWIRIDGSGNIDTAGRRAMTNPQSRTGNWNLQAVVGSAGTGFRTWTVRLLAFTTT